MDKMKEMSDPDLSVEEIKGNKLTLFLFNYSLTMKFYSVRNFERWTIITVMSGRITLFFQKLRLKMSSIMPTFEKTKGRVKKTPRFA